MDSKILSALCGSKSLQSLNQGKKSNQQTKTMANIQPLGQRVLVKRLEAEEISAGGIVLPDSVQEKPQEAEVVAIGTGGKDEHGNDFSFSVSTGDKVLISKYGGTDVKVDGEDHLLLSESDILGIIK